MKSDFTHGASFWTCLQKMILNLHSCDSDNHSFGEKSICLEAMAKSQPFPQPSMAHSFCSEHSHGPHLIQLCLSPSLAFLALLGAKSHPREPFLWEASGKCGGTVAPVSPHNVGCASPALMVQHAGPSETPSLLHLLLTKKSCP